MTIEQAKALLNKWFVFLSKLTPGVSGAFYSLLNDLQTLESIERYGLSQGMVDALAAIAPRLDNPGQFKTVEDVNRLIGPAAIKIFDQEMNENPQSGLYRRPQDMGWGVDVL
jgi:hypothetical protein